MKRSHRAVSVVLSLTLALSVFAPLSPAVAQDSAGVPVQAEPGSVGSTVPVEPTSTAQATPDDFAVPPADATGPAQTTEMAPAVVPYRLEDDTTSVVFGGRWAFRNTDQASGRSARVSATSGASARFAFTGTDATWLAPVGPDCGRARVYVDGAAVATVDLYRSDVASAQPVWSAVGLANKKHDVRVVVLGSRSASSTAANVGVDAFDFVGTPASPGTVTLAKVQNGSSSLYRKGRWTTVKRAAAFGGSTAQSTRRDAGYTVRFKGTAVTWYGSKDPSGGRSEVWIDGRLWATVDQYSPIRLERRVVYAASGLSNKVHTLRIRPLGEPAVSGGGTRTELDAFHVRGRVLFALRPTPFRYPWKNYIVIDKSSYRLYLVKNRVLRAVYPVAHGKNNCTPERVWRIDAKYPHTSGVYGPRKMRLFKRVGTSRGYRYVFSAYGIHGTNQPWVIGTQASHGCIRMYNSHVKELYPQVPLGTMVVTRK